MAQKYDRIWNFNAGPAAVPLEALEAIHEKWFNYEGAGMAVLEMSHRSKEYDAIHANTKALIKKLLGLSDDWHILFLQGGASTQFGMIPMNFLNGGTADYINTGTWSTKAIKEAKLFGNPNVAFDGNEVDFMRLPKQDELKLSADAKYVHITSNNTIKGTQFMEFPETNGVPLVCDASSDIMSHPLDLSKFGMIYAGAQKNLGPSGVTLVLLRDEFYKTAQTEGVFTMMKYSTHVDKDSLFNTPNSFGIYFMGEVLKWVDANGGLDAMLKRNQEKADILYGYMNESGDYYHCPVAEDSRSFMNVCFRLPDEEREQKFIKEGRAAGFNGLKGHRSVGGCRVSMYNATSPEAIKALVEFMKDFMANNG